MSFGRDTKSRRSLLPIVYERGVKDPTQGNGKKHVMDSLILEKENSETKPGGLRGGHTHLDLEGVVGEDEAKEHESRHADEGLHRH